MDNEQLNVQNDNCYATPRPGCLSLRLYRAKLAFDKNLGSCDSPLPVPEFHGDKAEERVKARPVRLFGNSR